MNYPLVSTTGIQLNTPSQLCQHLVRVHHEARHEESPDLPELCKQFGIVEYVEPPAPPKTPEQIAIAAREQFKMERQQIVDNIKVTTTAGNTFDGDETSQTRMARTIIGMQAAQVPTLVWVLADNSVINATVAELTEAMVLAGQAQASTWVQS